jgi:hypothetical protein
MPLQKVITFIDTAAKQLQFPFEPLKFRPHFGFIITKGLIFFVAVGTETGKIFAGGRILTLQVGVFIFQADGSPIESYDILSGGATGHDHHPDRKVQQQFLHNDFPVTCGCCQGKKNCPPTSSGQVHDSAGTLIGSFSGTVKLWVPMPFMGLSQFELITPILGPGFFIMAWIKGTLFTVADGRQSGSRNAQIYQISPSAFSPSFTQREVVFIRATFVAVALNGYHDTGIFS